MSVLVDEEAILGRAYDARLIRRLLAYVRPYRLTLLVSIALLLVASLADLAGPYLYRVAIDRYIAPHEARGTTADIRGLAGLAVFYLLILATGFLTRWLQGYLMQVAGQRVMADLRMRMFTHVLRLSAGFFSRTPVGRLVTRLTNDVDALNELITSGVVAIFGDAFALVGIMAVMLWMNWRLALAVFATLPLVYGVTEQFRSRSREAYRAVRTRLARLNAYLNEQVTGMTVVQLFNRERRNLDTFNTLNAAHLEANMEAMKNFSQFYPSIQLLGAIGIAILLWYGGGQVVRGASTLGVLVAAIQYAERFFDPIRDLADKFNLLQAAMAASERIFRVIDEPVVIEDPADPLPLGDVTGRIEFRDVWFAYADDAGWALRGVSFVIEPGERVAIVGHTGAGKTSIINLLVRFYDPQRGEVRLDGTDVRRLRQHDLRRHVAIVQQEPFLFSGTIEGNIRLGDLEISDARVRQAAERVGANRFIETLPDRYKTEVRERGAGFSAGQKQLIAFARALAHNPQILLILDEATSSVDPDTEALIQQAMTTALRANIAHHRAPVVNDSARRPDHRAP